MGTPDRHVPLDRQSLPSTRLDPAAGRNSTSITRKEETSNHLFDEEIRGHHSRRDHLLTVISDAGLDGRMPGQKPTFGELLVDAGDLQGVCTHSFETFTLDWTHRQLAPPTPVTTATLRA